MRSIAVREQQDLMGLGFGISKLVILSLDVKKAVRPVGSEAQEKVLHGSFILQLSTWGPICM